jgi:hypothetical protein
LTLIPVPSRSRVHERTKLCTAALLALSTLKARVPDMEVVEPLRMIELADLIRDSGFCTTNRAHFAFVAKLRSNCPFRDLPERCKRAGGGAGKEHVDVAGLLPDLPIGLVKIG